MPAHRTVSYRLASRLLRIPPGALLRLSGARPEPVVVDGRTLNPHLQSILALGERTLRRADQDVATRRAELRRLAAMGMPQRTDVRVTDRRIPGPDGAPDLAVRVYHPYGDGSPRPVVVYLHGGGWVVGDLDTHDGCCRHLAVEASCVVVAVDYRLAPEHPFPAAVQDAFAAYRWVQGHALDLAAVPGCVGVMGDSAGGNLAAVVAQLAHDDPDVPDPVAQALVYPSVDAHMRQPSIDAFAEGFFLSRDDMHWYRHRYVPDEADWDDPRVSPLLREDLTGLAPAVVVTAGFDPLRDEGRAYAERLLAAGVPVRYRCYDDLVHGFFGMGVLPGGLAVVTEVCRSVGRLLEDAARRSDGCGSVPVAAGSAPGPDCGENDGS